MCPLCMCCVCVIGLQTFCILLRLYKIFIADCNKTRSDQMQSMVTKANESHRDVVDHGVLEGSI